MTRFALFIVAALVAICLVPVQVGASNYTHPTYADCTLKGTLLGELHYISSREDYILVDVDIPPAARAFIVVERENDTGPMPYLYNETSQVLSNPVRFPDFGALEVTASGWYRAVVDPLTPREAIYNVSVCYRPNGFTPEPTSTPYSLSGGGGSSGFGGYDCYQIVDFRFSSNAWVWGWYVYQPPSSGGGEIFWNGIGSDGPVLSEIFDGSWGVFDPPVPLPKIGSPAAVIEADAQQMVFSGINPLVHHTLWRCVVVTPTPTPTPTPSPSPTPNSSCVLARPVYEMGVQASITLERDWRPFAYQTDTHPKWQWVSAPLLQEFKGKLRGWSRAPQPYFLDNTTGQYSSWFVHNPLGISYQLSGYDGFYTSSGTTHPASLTYKQGLVISSPAEAGAYLELCPFPPSTPTPSPSPSPTVTGTPSPTRTASPTRTPSPTLVRVTPSPIPTRTAMPTRTPTTTPTGTLTGTLTSTPTGSPTGTLTGTLTSTPTGIPTGTPTTFIPTATPFALSVDPCQKLVIGELCDAYNFLTNLDMSSSGCVTPISNDWGLTQTLCQVMQVVAETPVADILTGGVLLLLVVSLYQQAFVLWNRFLD